MKVNIRVHCIAPKVLDLRVRDGWAFGKQAPNPSLKEIGNIQAMFALEGAMKSADPAQLHQPVGFLVEALRATEGPNGPRAAKLLADTFTRFKETSEAIGIGVVPETALRDFLKLNETDESALGFVLQYGLFSHAHARERNDLPAHVREHWSKIAGRTTLPMAFPLAELWAEKRRVTAVVQIITKLYAKGSRGDKKSNRAALQAAHAIDAPAPLDAMGWAMAEHLANAVVGIDSDEKAIRPVVSAYDVATALYVFLWKNLLLRSPIGTCARCGSIFDITKPGQEFCSPRCQKAAKTARARAKRTRGSAAPGGT